MVVPSLSTFPPWGFGWETEVFHFALQELEGRGEREGKVFGLSNTLNGSTRSGRKKRERKHVDGDTWKQQLVEEGATGPAHSKGLEKSGMIGTMVPDVPGKASPPPTP